MLGSIFTKLFYRLEDDGIYIIDPITGWANSYDEVMREIYSNPFEDAISTETVHMITTLKGVANDVGRRIEDMWEDIVFDAAKEYREDPGVPFYNKKKRIRLILHHIKKSGHLYSNRIIREDTDLADEELSDMSILYPDWKVAD